MKKVLVTSPDVPQIGIDLLSARWETTVNQTATREEILKIIPGMDAVFWSTKVKVDKEMLDAAGPQLRIVSVMSAGLDHIDVEELKRRGIKLASTPGILSATVAETTVMLALAASRRMQEGRRHIENATWIISYQFLLGYDLKGSTVGVVGLGSIGQAIVKRFKSFEVKRFVYSGHGEKKEGRELGAEFVSFEELLAVSDFVIAACPLTPETKEMFNEKAFGKMKKKSVFVNIARGEIVDQPALIRALSDKIIFAAGLDVMTPEPLPKNHELLALSNCVITPHIGSASIQTRSAMAELTANNILFELDDKPLLTPFY